MRSTKYAARRYRARMSTPSPMSSSGLSVFLAPIEGNLSASASVAIAPKLAANSPCSVTTTKVYAALGHGSESKTELAGTCPRTTSTIKPKDPAAACIAGMIGLLTGLSGFESAAGREMRGHPSLSSSSRFALSCGRKKVDPVRCPWALPRLETDRLQWRRR